MTGLLFPEGLGIRSEVSSILHQNQMGYLFKLKIWLQPSAFGWGLEISYLVNSLGDLHILNTGKYWTGIYGSTRLSPS